MAVVVPLPGHGVEFTRQQDVDVADSTIGIGGHAGEDGTESSRELVHGDLVEQVDRIGDRSGHTRRSTGVVEPFRDGQLEVELRDVGVDVDGLDGEFG
ncbi:unannotated protein [freshwater metagenome]|uniref:Unannotated protein n=1 Tax=freshwater metagenome TaxID=449393 RepID=A0A6J7F3U5_9ZZZZ